MNFLAQKQNQLSTPLSGVGPLGNPADAANKLAKILSTVIGVLTIIAAIYFMFTLMFSAIAIISAGGDKSQVEDARRRMTNGFIGLVITIAAMFIMDIVARLLGIPSILDIQAMINLVTQ
jgi:ABC-type phosphate transport system permease subunit